VLSFGFQTANLWGVFMMTKSSLLSALLGVLFVAGLAIAPAHAQATRTWVSGVGDDANPCSRTAPCKTFAGAISKTSAAGEINVLDPGGFGAVTITKSISIYNDGVGEAGVLVSGTNGIVITAPGGIVNLRGLVINGLNTSINGVLINAAASVEISNCVIQEMGNGAGSGGVLVAPSTGTTTVAITNSIILNNNADGVLVKPSGGATANVTITRSNIENNTGTDGVRANANGGGNVHVAIADSSVSLNTGNGATAVSGGSNTATIDLTRVTLAGNTTNGLASNNASGGTAAITVGASMLSFNGAATSISSSGTVQSFGNNQVTGPVGSGFTSISPM
jgi:hypothetical protein